jgi:2-alkyl-3-oxoalkanoate reductase
MRILITGVAGFIGSRLAVRLMTAGHEVVGTGRLAGQVVAGVDRYEAADLTRPADCERTVQGVAAVIHCAGKAGAWGSDESYTLANVTATGLLLDAAKRAGVTRFVNLSSPSIYFAFKHQVGLKETDLPERFSNAYARTKYEAEQLVTAARSPGFATVSLRPRGVIGAGDRNWLPRIIAMREANALIQPGDGTNLAEFTAVENLLDAIELCLGVPEARLGNVYNVTNGRPERLWDVIGDALRAVGLDGKRRKVPLPVAMLLARLSEKRARLLRRDEEPELLPVKVGVAAYTMTMDISRARTELGYVPRQTTADAVREFAAWWRGRKGLAP